MKPRSLLKSTVANPRETGLAEYEHYEWPGDYFTKSEGEMLTRIRMEEQCSPGSRVQGSGNIRTLMTGFYLHPGKLSDSRSEPGISAGSDHAIYTGQCANTAAEEQHFSYSTSFELHPTSEVYRPQRTLSKTPY